MFADKMQEDKVKELEKQRIDLEIPRATAQVQLQTQKQEAEIGNANAALAVTKEREEHEGKMREREAQLQADQENNPHDIEVRRIAYQKETPQQRLDLEHRLSELILQPREQGTDADRTGKEPNAWLPKLTMPMCAGNLLPWKEFYDS